METVITELDYNYLMGQAGLMAGMIVAFFIGRSVL
jgi:hypothetical protein